MDFNFYGISDQGDAARFGAFLRWLGGLQKVMFSGIGRRSLSGILAFSVAWSLVVYSPVTHWVWGWLAWKMGLLDFAGGIAITVMGAGLLWLVWFGFNGGKYTEGRWILRP